MFKFLASKEIVKELLMVINKNNTFRTIEIGQEVKNKILGSIYTSDIRACFCIKLVHFREQKTKGCIIGSDISIKSLKRKT
jgi:hypothetical protein